MASPTSVCGGAVYSSSASASAAEREHAYDTDPLLGAGTDQLLTEAATHGWPVIDMATDWETVFPAGG